MIQSRNSCGASSFSSSMLAHLFASDGNEVKGGRVACPKTWGGRTPSLPMDMAQREQLPDDGGQHAEHNEVRHNEQVWKHGGVPGTLDLTLMLHRGQTLSSAEDRRRSGAPTPPMPRRDAHPYRVLVEERNQLARQSYLVPRDEAVDSADLSQQCQARTFHE